MGTVLWLPWREAYLDVKQATALSAHLPAGFSEGPHQPVLGDPGAERKGSSGCGPNPQPCADLSVCLQLESQRDLRPDGGPGWREPQ